DRARLASGTAVTAMTTTSTPSSTNSTEVHDRPEPRVATGAAFGDGTGAGVEFGTDVSAGAVCTVVGTEVDTGGGVTGAPAVSCGRLLRPGSALGAAGST